MSLPGFLQLLLSSLHHLLHSLFSLIYDLIFSRPVTGFTYCRLLARLKSTPAFKAQPRILDVGVGTGTALGYIIADLPQDCSVLGVDIDEHYVDTCQGLFKDRPNVKIQLRDFYEMKPENGFFDMILFTSSFMLLPDHDQALKIARRLLKPNGKVYFVLTLFKKRQSLVSRFKPLLKYLLTVDFGQALTEKQFLEILSRNGLNVDYKERVMRRWVPCFHVFRYFLVEASWSAEKHGKNPSSSNSMPYFK